MCYIEMSSQIFFHTIFIKLSKNVPNNRKMTTWEQVGGEISLIDLKEWWKGESRISYNNNKSVHMSPCMVWYGVYVWYDKCLGILTYNTRQGASMGSQTLPHEPPDRNTVVASYKELIMPLAPPYTIYCSDHEDRRARAHHTPSSVVVRSSTR